MVNLTAFLEVIALKSLKRWFTFAAISLSLTSVDVYPVFANDAGVPLPSAMEYVLTESMRDTAAHNDTSLPKPEGRVLPVLASEYQFIPNVLEIRRGEVIALQIKNEGKETHNLTFTTLSLKTVDIPAGGNAQLQLPATLAPGRYPFVCTIPGHLERGMRGVLVVR